MVTSPEPREGRGGRRGSRVMELLLEEEANKASSNSRGGGSAGAGKPGGVVTMKQSTLLSVHEQYLESLKADGVGPDAAAVRPRMPSGSQGPVDSGANTPQRRRSSSVIGGDMSFTGLARGRNRAVRCLR